MLHFSCDLCGRQLEERRFVAKLEVFPAFDPDELDEDDLDADHLQEVAETIQEMEATGAHVIEDCGAKHFRFDLCCDCHSRFVKDPLGRDTVRHLNFSEN